MTMRLAMIASVILTATSAAAGPTTVFFDPPGARDTYVAGITASGVVAGDYRDAVKGSCKRNCGYLRKPDGSFETFRLPKHRSLMGVSAVNDANTVVGFYYDRGEPLRRVHGFLRQEDGTFVDVRVHHGDTDFSAINDSGVAAGRYYVGEPFMGHYNGFVRLPDGEIETFHARKDATIEVRGINAAGVVVGSVNIAVSHRFGFTRALGGEVEHFSAPDCGPSTLATAIDDEGDVAGICSEFSWRGFLRDADGTFHIFDVPGGFTDPEVSGVARVGTDTQVVGQATSPGHLAYGFVRHGDGTIETFSLSTKGKDGTHTRVTGIAPSGAVVGFAYPDSYKHAHGYIRTP